MVAQVEITGVDDVLRRFFRFRRGTDDMTTVFDAVGAAVAARARQMVPRRTGALGGTITYSRGANWASVSAGSSVPYAGVIEYGWARHRIAAEPYLRPAASGQTNDAVRELEQQIQREIKAAGLG